MVCPGSTNSSRVIRPADARAVASSRPDSSPPVAFSGEPGAFAEDAVIAAFGAEVARQPVGGFREVFEAVAAGTAEAGVVPIENLVNGSVREVYDLLLEHDLQITGEVVVPVELCLAALPGRTIDDVIDPADSRRWIATLFDAPRPAAPKRAYIDTW